MSLLALHQVPRIETLDIRRLWQRTDEQLLLRAPIGLQRGGTLLLDLKEPAMGGFGPHGLVVGTTGSGKTELLRTIVTSLSLTHDPFLLNFVLVTALGGTAFAAFEKLAHVAGIITNQGLEYPFHDLGRLSALLLGELQRRQRMLAQAGNLATIHQYQAKWRRHPTRMEPMPYLLLIVDDLSELLPLDNVFLKLLVRLGQAGGSLGMHMMLATARMDEGPMRKLEGHLRCRVCLRTRRPEESTAVIGRPDASSLPSAPGSGYLKVDHAIFTGFQAALASMPYAPQKRQQVNLLTLIRTFPSTWRPVLSREPPAEAEQEAGEEEVRTEINAAVERIAQVPPPRNGWRVHVVC